MSFSTPNELHERLDAARSIAPLWSQWEHKKGGIYEVIDHLIDTDNGFVRVSYKRIGGPEFNAAAEDGIVFTRSIGEWTVDRFTRIA